MKLQYVRIALNATVAALGVVSFDGWLAPEIAIRAAAFCGMLSLVLRAVRAELPGPPA